MTENMSLWADTLAGNDKWSAFENITFTSPKSLKLPVSITALWVLLPFLPLSLHASHCFHAWQNFLSPLHKQFLLLLLRCDHCDVILLWISLVLLFFCIYMIPLLPNLLVSFVYLFFFLVSVWPLVILLFFMCYLFFLLYCYIENK